MDNRFEGVTVVEGEASESDDEFATAVNNPMRYPPPDATRDISNPGSQSLHREESDSSTDRVPPTPPNKHANSTSGVLVSGEASESDDETAEVISPVASLSGSLLLDTPLKVEAASKSVSSSPGSGPSISSPTSKPPRLFRYDSLLHKKLNETNDNLKIHIEGFKRKQLETAAKDLRNVSAQLCKSQAALKEVSAALRVTSNDLFQLEDKLDIVATCTLIPYINIAPLQNVRNPVGNQLSNQPQR